VGDKNILVALYTVAGAMVGALVAYALFMPARWSEVKLIVYFFGLAGAAVGHVIARMTKSK
jgi:hypothetical protein